MGRSIEQLASEIRTSDSQESAKLAGKIFEVSQDEPEAVGRSEAEAIFEALTLEVRTVRLKLSAALFEIAKADGNTVVPIASDIIDFLSRERPVGQVRSNLGRPIGDAVVAHPAVIDEEQIPVLSSELKDDEDGYRHSIAWILELLAFVRPDEVFPERDDLLKNLNDIHPPVLKHVYRAIANLERHESFLSQSEVEEIAGHLNHDYATVRTAAGLALGANQSKFAIERLEQRRKRESNSDVKLNLRHSVREASFPGPDVVLRSGAIHSLREDDWVSVEPHGVDPRTGRFRGQVTDVSDQGETAGDLPKRALLTNPYEGYELELQFDEGTLLATYCDRRKSDALSFAVKHLEEIDFDHLSLLYAISGDELDTQLDLSTFKITVEETVQVESGKRIIGTDTSDQKIEFRPCEHRPLLARFHEGRCFESRYISLRPPDTES